MPAKLARIQLLSASSSEIRKTSTCGGLETSTHSNIHENHGQLGGNGGRGSAGPNKLAWCWRDLVAWGILEDREVYCVGVGTGASSRVESWEAVLDAFNLLTRFQGHCLHCL